MRTPLELAAPSPPKNDRGTDTTSAQGQETTRNVNPRRTHSDRVPNPRIGGRRAIANAE